MIEQGDRTLQCRRSLATLLTAILLCAPFGTSAQERMSALDAVLANIDVRTQELDRVDELLASEDPNRRLAAMEALLASGDPAFVERAAETGLFSEDVRLRETAIRAVLQTGGPFTLRLDLSATDDEQSMMLEWLGYSAGATSADLAQGSVTFTVDPFDEKAKCWYLSSSSGSKHCGFVLTGETVSLSGWRYTAGSLTLDDAAILSGAVSNERRKGVPVPARIDLLE